ncbi:filamentous hemagglutinin N-terminal domain-containing protein [Paraburkholderia pallida]|uniref:two-partner secretion domain-containing protein n=1 Tax=Paraburkholderia pallida TaxID=2547399 RepID=UPI0014303A33|nr:filamentous hemagglutinin N-terminal domain-containing protein [Paraburkholderia pallida]
MAAPRRRAHARLAAKHAHPLQAKAIASVVAALFEAIWASSVLANPTGAQVVAGGVTVSSPSSTQMNITQSTPNAIVNWNTFSIGAGEAVNIAQPSVTSALLNRVVGNDPSNIAGRLSANGRVFLVNPAGVIFAPGSSVNVGSLVASTLGISNADFLAGNFHFVGNAPGAVVNAGSITAADGGTIALLGGSVTNSGMVAAKLGTVAVGAGSDVTLDFAGDGLTTLKVNSGAANAFLGNTGTLAADGGTVVMSAQTADALAGTVINQQGIVRAQSLAARDGHIVLDGGTNGETLVSGTLDASGGAGLTGGQVDVTGYNVALLAGANVNASGAAGGGSVRFGGGSAGKDPTIRDANAVWMDPNAQIHADALTNGNGGHIVAYGTTAARLYGTLTANGGPQGGNGGYIETSGHYLDTSGATVQALAPKGKGGTWELDPFELDIVAQPTGTPASGPTSTGSSSVMFGPDPNSSVLMFTAIENELNSGTSVTVSTVNSPASPNGVGTINVEAPIQMTGTAPATLKLSASGSINVYDNIFSTGGPLGVVIDANIGGTSPAYMVTLQSVNIATNGGAVAIGTNGASQVSIQSTTISTSGGNLTITGTAPTSDSAVNAVDIENSQITTGAGTLAVTGTIGTASAGSNGGGNGLYLYNSSLSVTSGNVTLDGTIYTDTTGYGVDLVDSSVGTTTGNIDLTGTALGTAAGSGNNFVTGVYLNYGYTAPTTGATLQPTLQTTSGNIAMTGTASGSGAIGTWLQTATVENTTGQITLNGTVNTAAATSTSTSPVTVSARQPELSGGDGPWGVGLVDSTLGNSSGNINVNGIVQAQYDYGVGTEISSSVIGTTSGAITLTGLSSGTPAANTSVQGIVLENPGSIVPVGVVAAVQLPAAGGTTAIQSDTGSISIYGSGTGTGTQGVLITSGTTIESTGGGAIDIRGAVRGGPQPTGSSSNVQNDAGVVINNATINSSIGAAPSVSGTQGSIAIAGSTDTADYGLVLGNGLSGYFGEGSVTISTGTSGTLVLRAANDGTVTSLGANGLTVQVPLGTLAILPGSVDPSSFALVAQNATPITLYGTGAGLSIDQPTLGLLTQDVGTVVVGSDTHTGLITVNGVCVGESVTCVSMPTFTTATNLTLENDGSGSQGIQLLYGLSLGTGNTLTLASAGTVTQGGAIQTSTLGLAGPGTFTLTNASNTVGTLMTAGTGSADFVDSQNVSLNVASMAGFATASGAFTSLGSTTALSIAGDLTVSTPTASISVSAPIESTASGTATLTLSAGGGISIDAAGVSQGNDTIGAGTGAGPLNVTLDANTGGTGGNQYVGIVNTTFNTNGGNFTIGDTGSSVVSISNATIDTQGGAVNITGTNGFGDGVAIGYSAISAAGGNVTITGTSLYDGNGITLNQSTIGTTNGTIQLTGTGNANAITGQSIFNGVLISGAGPGGAAAIDVTGTGAVTLTGTMLYGPGDGVQLANASIVANGGAIGLSSTASGSTAVTGIQLNTSTIGNTSGAVTLTGNGSIEGVALSYSSIATGSGNTTLTGTATGNGIGIGLSSTALSTSGGSITLTGTGGTSASSFAYGVESLNVGSGAPGTTLTTGGNGAIAITGTATGGFGQGVDLGGAVLTTAGGGVTVTGTANVTSSGAGVGLFNTQMSSGAGNVLIDGTTNVAPGQPFADGTGITAFNSSILTTSGTVTLSGTTTGAPSIAYGTLLSGGYTANGSTTVQPTIQTGSGAIAVKGSVPATSSGSLAVDLISSDLTSTSGTIALTGLTTGTPTTGLSSTGVVLGAANSDSSSSSLVTVSTPPTTLTTGSGTLSIYGSGSGSGAQGVLVADGSQITSNNGGAIDIRGVVTSPTTSTSGGNIQYDYGTLIYNGTISATAPNTTISIAGSTNTSDAGVALGAVPVPSSNFYYTSGTVQVNAGVNGTLAVRAANDGTVTSFADSGAAITSSGGTLVFMPASVNPTTFAFTALDATPITLFGTGAAGLSIEAATYSLFSGFSTLVLGSSTQTGLITVSGVCPSQGACSSLSKPTTNQSLTLINTGSGSQGIQLLYGISLGSNTLTLASAGAVTDPGGIQAAGLLLQGPGNFTLNDPQNDVGVLAMLNAGNVNFLNSTSFVIGPIVSRSFDAASNAATTIDATNSTLTGNLLAQAATGGIGLGGGTAAPNGPTGGKNTNLSAGGTIDLVMENGVFTDNGTGSISATNGWRIWASTWNGETRGNVQPNTAQPNFYGCSYGAGCSWGGVVPLSGDHFVYVARPTVIVTANGEVKIEGAPNPNFGFTISGLINGDPGSTLSGTLSSSATSGSPPGQYAIDPAFFSSVGYIVQNVPGTLTVTAPPPAAPRYDPDLPLAVSAMQSFFGMSEKTFVYENNLQGTNICVGSNQPLFTTTPPGDNQDLLAVEWKRVRSQPNLNSCMLLNGQHGCGDF